MAEQLRLPLDEAPLLVRAHGLLAAHPRPLVSFGKRPGRPFASFRTSPSKAWRYPELEYGNAGSSVAAVVLDCDDPAAMARGMAELPPPNWKVTRPANDHAHIAWTLAKPVHRYPAARPEPLQFLARIAEYYATATGADPGYAGVLAHNPAAKFKSAYRTTWGREAPYTLDQLANVIPFGWEAPIVRRTAVGRNVDLFEAGMRWAGSRTNAHLPVLPALLVANQEFACPLPLSEVQATARSIEKYRERWAARGWHGPRWIARQRARARKGGRPRKYEPGREPWVLAGISRATWYRRRRVRQKPTQINAPARGQARSSLRPAKETDMNDIATELTVDYDGDGTATLTLRWPVDRDIAARAETDPAAMAEIYQAASEWVGGAADRCAAR